MAEEKWRLSEKIEILVEEFANDAIVYCVDSGETHLFNTLALDVLNLLRGTPMDVAQVVQALAEKYQDFDSSERQRQVAALIDDLDHLGFVEPGDA